MEGDGVQVEFAMDEGLNFIVSFSDESSQKMIDEVKQKLNEGLEDIAIDIPVNDGFVMNFVLDPDGALDMINLVQNKLDGHY